MPPSPPLLFLHQDQLGSVRILTDSSGAVRATFTYDPNGSLTASTGSVTTPFAFAGQYRDRESGFYYLRARYYDPATAQFVSRDPAVATMLSPYRYVSGDPVNATDPLGLCVYGVDPNCQGEGTIVPRPVDTVPLPTYGPSTPPGYLACEGTAAGSFSQPCFTSVLNFEESNTLVFPVGAENQIPSSCGDLVLVEEATEPVTPADRAEFDAAARLD